MITSLLLAAKAQNNTMLKSTFQILKLFGIGVIAGTAWIHVLPDAFAQFSNPCHDPQWASYGTKFVGLFGCIAAFLTQIIEQGAVSHAHNKCNSDQQGPGSIHSLNSHDEHSHSHLSHQNNGHNHDHGHNHENPHLSHNRSNSSSSTTEENYTLELTAVVADPFAPKKQLNNANTVTGIQLEKSVTAIVLEVGILVHSLIIGITLGVASDSEFNSLLITICCHEILRESL